MIDVAENQAVSDRTIAIDSNISTCQREASAAGCNDSDVRLDDVVGIVALVFPKWNRVGGRRSRETYVTRLIAHGSLELAGRLVGPDLVDFNPAGDFLVNADGFDKLRGNLRWGGP